MTKLQLVSSVSGPARPRPPAFPRWLPLACAAFAFPFSRVMHLAFGLPLEWHLAVCFAGGAVFAALLLLAWRRRQRRRPSWRDVQR